MEKRFFIDKADSTLASPALNDREGGRCYFNNKVPHEKIILDGEEFEHLSRVLRLGVGDSAECFCDGSDVYACKIEQIGKKEAILSVINKYPCKSNPQVRVTVFQALVKGDKLELITQKLSELGVSELVLFSSRFTNLKPSMVRVDRLQKIAVGAAKQCGRTAVMKIRGPLEFDEMLKELKNHKTIIFANENEKKGQKMQFGGDIAIIIGSEGGFEAGESDKIIDSGAHSISLGKRILRSETAAIALTSIVMHEVGEL